MICNHPTRYLTSYGCRICLSVKRKESKAERLERIAREMRERNLTHGMGCKSKARAIAERLAATVDLEDSHPAREEAA